MQRTRLFQTLLIVLLSSLVGCRATPTPSPTLTLATTTSTYDSGLLDAILPDFEAQTGVRVKVVAVGTGQALQIGRDGNADVLLVHAPALEETFVAEGHGVNREPVMYNDFVIVGPADDPAGVRSLQDAAEALRRIAEAQATFVSRGDQSGTHVKEMGLWEAAGIQPAGEWYRAAGQGMGAVLTLADELSAYTLSDRGTFLARRETGLRLEILVEGDPRLFNPYHVMAVNPERHPNVHAREAEQFITWLISLPTQERIAQFGVDRYGQPLFTPDSRAWHEAHP